MEQLQTYVYAFLATLGVSTDTVFFGNTVGAYAWALTVFVVAMALFGLMQYFALSWLDVLARRTATDMDDVLVKMVRSVRPPFYSLLSLWIALRFLSVSDVIAKGITALLVLWVVYQVVVLVGILVEDVLFRHALKDKDPTTKSAVHLIANILRGVIWVFGILLVLSNFGVNVTSLVAGAGIAGIAIAFAIQGILSDLFSSFSLYFDKPFRVNDFIVVGNVKGTVRHIGVKSTRIRSVTGEEITMSNQELTSAQIHNFGRMDERRASFTFGILYETPIDTVRRIPDMVRAIIERIDGARFERAHFVHFGDSSLDFEVVYYILSSEYMRYRDIQQEINIALMEQFEKEKIGFAYPTRTVYLANND